VTDAPIVALSHEITVAAIAIGGHLETRSPDGIADRADFQARIGALAWSGTTLYVAEAGRVHRLNVEGLGIESTVQLQSGRVDAVIPIPNDAWDPRDTDRDGLTDIPERDRRARVLVSDSDGDGLLDGVDPDNQTPNAVLQIVQTVELHQRAAGYELKIVRIDATPTNSGRWEVTSDLSATPWLDIDETAGAIPGGPRIRIDARAMIALPDEPFYCRPALSTRTVRNSWAVQLRCKFA
jgi:hypothetical protein